MADKGDYNPYENRNVESPLSNWGAFVSLLKCIVGTGVLALPLAFHYAGIVMAIFLLLLCTFLLIHGMQLLIYSMVECSRRLQIGYSTFPEAMIYSFAQGPGCFRYCAKAGGYLVDGVLAFSHYGVCVVYIVFVASSFKQICDFYWVVWDVRIFIAVVGLLLIPIFLIRSLKWLVPFNLAAMVFIYSGFLVMFYYLFSGLPSLSERDIVFGKVENIGLFFGIALFAVSSVGVMIAIEAKMAKPETYLGWFGVLDLAIIVVLISYTLFGFFGYWRYGDKLQGSISLNLPTDEIASQVSKLLIAVAIFLTYPLSGYVVIDIIMTHYWNKNDELKHAKLKETAIRISFVILSTLNAVVAPNLGPLLSLVGAFTISLLNLIFPALIEICLYYPPEFNYGRWKWKLWKDIILIIVGTVILIEGTYFAIVAMVKEYGRSEDSGDK
ncbi:glutamate transporter polyphemus-like [Drosophila kikkawai]|uniref:Glutamate transporter polyphemus-like n=1 Tax=Drosophila kikkawai TaxID=30033 RepID=A0A6P4ID19_DROKI|nr:glutamate transporter polyphemus-like [Drosophila kikkawai]